MPTATKQFLSASTNGRGIKLAATATPGTTIHTAANVAGTFDEIWLWADHAHTASVDVTIEFGGATAPDDVIVFTLDPKTGLFIVIPGLVLAGGLALRGFASVANVVSVQGYVNRLVN